ncbi:hypothetical protein [uncultured Desulfosarcina sp.]|uniref:hypothetical protein n=1 Tax=uncultured Desulfosarcina sp. TaxID=218289 RepID=UPI0029C91265|nr:hypothetical protein [uncultured Desulfosarcina sp.]
MKKDYWFFEFSDRSGDVVFRFLLETKESGIGLAGMIGSDGHRRDAGVAACIAHHPVQGFVVISDRI